MLLRNQGPGNTWGIHSIEAVVRGEVDLGTVFTHEAAGVWQLCINSERLCFELDVSVHAISSDTRVMVVTAPGVIAAVIL
jgi:hypothetical protein